jgi:hypothetical protein
MGAPMARNLARGASRSRCADHTAVVKYWERLAGSEIPSKER